MNSNPNARVGRTLALLALLWIWSPCRAMEAQQGPDQARVTAPAGANVRAGGGTNQAVLVRAPTGTILPVLRRQGEWVVVGLSPEFGTAADSGFVHISTVTIIAGPPRSAAANTTTPQAPQGAGTPAPPVSSSTPSEAAVAGMAAGSSKGLALPIVLSATTSFAMPGLGLVYLLFLDTGEVQPNFAQQAFLRDKSPEYVQSWTESYDRALSGRQRRAIYIGTAAGSVAAILFYGAVLSSAGGY